MLFQFNVHFRTHACSELPWNVWRHNLEEKSIRLRRCASKTESPTEYFSVGKPIPSCSWLLSHVWNHLYQVVSMSWPMITDFMICLPNLAWSSELCFLIFESYYLLWSFVGIRLNSWSPFLLLTSPWHRWRSVRLTIPLLSPSEVFRVFFRAYDRFHASPWSFFAERNAPSYGIHAWNTARTFVWIFIVNDPHLSWFLMVHF